MTIRLSDLARADHEDIRDYTVETWGHTQWLTYCRQIVHAFEQITGNPQTGTGRSWFVSGMRSINCQKHVISFKCLDSASGAPVVLCIVRGRRCMSALVYHDDLNGA